MAWKYSNQVAGIHEREPGEYLESSYRYHRRVNPLMLAYQAIALARMDRDSKQMRYVASTLQAWNSGRTFKAYGEQMRWIENPNAGGLRLVGFADELCDGIQHTGWYLDEFCGEMARGVVYQGPSRRGRPQFFAGYADPYNNGAICIALDIIEGESGYFSTNPAANPDAADAAYRADRIAELMAEESREYAEVTGARCNFEAMGEERAGIRTATLALIRELKTARRTHTPGRFPAICERLVADVRANLESMADLLNQRESLARDFAHHDGWNDC